MQRLLRGVAHGDPQQTEAEVRVHRFEPRCSVERDLRERAHDGCLVGVFLHIEGAVPLQPRRVLGELTQRDRPSVARRIDELPRPGDPARERIVESEHAVVTERQECEAGEGLRDRTDAINGIGIRHGFGRRVDDAEAFRVGELAVDHDANDDAWHVMRHTLFLERLVECRERRREFCASIRIGKAWCR